MFTLIDAYSGKPIATYNAPDDEKQHYARADAFIVDGVVSEDYVESLLSLKSKTVGIVNGLAGEKILNAYPDWKQRNMTARFVQLMTLNQLDSQEALDLKKSWLWIESIRALSNEFNISVNNSVIADDVSAVLTKYKTNLNLL